MLKCIPVYTWARYFKKNFLLSTTILSYLVGLKISHNTHTSIWTPILGKLVVNIIEKAFYTNHKHGKLPTMLSKTVDNFYLSSIDQQVEDTFFKYMSSESGITSPKNTNKIDFLSLHIYFSKFGTSVDQTYHIYKKIMIFWTWSCYKN